MSAPPAVPVTHPPRALSEARRRVDARLHALLSEEHRRWSAVDPLLDEPLDRLRVFALEGGKRLRPAFCRLGHLAGGGDEADPTAVDAGAALELLHVFALVHDDVMDGSHTRRGCPTVHEHFDARHRAQGWAGESRRFGEGMAVLIGDLALVLADKLLAGADRCTHDVFDELRLELVMGQLLDVGVAANRSMDAPTSRRISLFKSAKYTVERPLHLGAALTGRLDALAPTFSAYGLALGEAFQLRDDVLGAYGDCGITGKPVGEDFREAKPTQLVVHALGVARRAGHRPSLTVLDRLGQPDLAPAEVAAIQDVLDSTGARAAVEARIELLLAESLDALAGSGIDPSTQSELVELAIFCCRRDR